LFIRVRMLAECSYNDRYYEAGKEYPLTNKEYSALAQACEIIKGNVKFFNYKRILVVIDHGIGNIILKTPMLKKLRQLYPESIINVMVGRMGYKTVLEGLPFIDKIYSKESICFDSSYDLVINSLPSGISLTGIKGKVITGEQMWYIQGHEVEANMKILLSLGWDGDDIPKQSIAVDKVDFPAGKYIGISAGYGEESYWKIKNWGYNKFGELVTLLLAEYPDYKVLIFGREKDGNVLKYCKSDRVISCVDKYTIRQTAYVISLCEFMIANDTGLGHIASAVGVRIYSVFGPTSRIKNRPYTGGIVISREDLDCEPCQFTVRWPGCRGRKCMDITAKEVFNVIKKKQNRRFDLGVLICTYDRYEFLLTTLNSYILCKNLVNIKFCIVDDGSCDEYVDAAIMAFKNALPVSCMLEVVKHGSNYGKAKYGETMREGVEALKDCPYILFSPDDIVVNPWLFDVVRESIKLLTINIRAISHMADERAENGRYMKPQYRPIEKYNNFYKYVVHTDGFLSLLSRESMAEVNFNHSHDDSGSGVWTALNRQFAQKGWKQLRLNESLCFHFGNIKSRMNAGERAIHPLRSVRFNLNRKPEVLK